ncbi:hypothetical protein [Arthrobacter sp. JCM 19049]|nr:hypothetical protein [Arthrobacter sp. JCM 19049]
MPTAEDLDDPASFTSRRETAASEFEDFDAQLGKLLDGGFEATDDPQDPEDPDGPQEPKP